LEKGLPSADRKNKAGDVKSHGPRMAAWGRKLPPEGGGEDLFIGKKGRKGRAQTGCKPASQGLNLVCISSGPMGVRNREAHLVVVVSKGEGQWGDEGLGPQRRRKNLRWGIKQRSQKKERRRSKRGCSKKREEGCLEREDRGERSATVGGKGSVDKGRRMAIGRCPSGVKTQNLGNLRGRNSSAKEREDRHPGATEKRNKQLVGVRTSRHESGGGDQYMDKGIGRNRILQ